MTRAALLLPLLLSATACAGSRAHSSGASPPQPGVAFAQDTSMPKRKSGRVVCGLERETGSMLLLRICRTLPAEEPPPAVLDAAQELFRRSGSIPPQAK